MNGQLWWYAARSTGLVAWGAAAASVIWGLLLSTRSARGLAKPAWVLDLHRWLAVLTLAATGAHLGALVADTYVHFGLADLLVPFASSWKPAPVAWGILAFWLLVLVEVSSLVKQRIPHRLWMRIHLGSFVAYVLATLHYLQAGTERTNAAVLLTVEVVTGIVLFLTLVRILAPRGRAARRSGPRVPAGASRSARQEELGQQRSDADQEGAEGQRRQLARGGHVADAGVAGLRPRPGVGQARQPSDAADGQDRDAHPGLAGEVVGRR